MALKQTEDKGVFLSVLADGKFHMPANEGDTGAVLRTYETSTGESGSKWEKLFDEAIGILTSIKFYDGNFGTNVILTLEDEGEEPINLSFSCNSNFGEDVLKKLPAIDRTIPVRIVPYAFVDDNGKNKKGVTIYQGENKVQSFYHSYNEKSKTSSVQNGYPKAPVAKKGKTISSDEWKLYFAQARLFMIDDIKERLNLEDEPQANTGVGSEGDDF